MLHLRLVGLFAMDCLATFPSSKTPLLMSAQFHIILLDNVMVKRAVALCLQLLGDARFAHLWLHAVLLSHLADMVIDICVTHFHSDEVREVWFDSGVLELVRSRNGTRALRTNSGRTSFDSNQ